MNYAIQKDGQGWRAANGPDDVGVNETYSDTMPTPTLDQIKSRKWDAIKTERDRRKAGGVKVMIGDVEKWFHSDDTSRIQQMGLLMMGSNMPSGLQWKTLDNSFVTMTPAIAYSIFTAVAASDHLNFSAAETHRAALEVSVDPEAYDYSTGWPACYGG